MRPPSSSLPIVSLFLSISCSVSARLLHHHSLPDDTYAFPKYRVTFLNGLPVSNETAERWLHEGLRGGELEFLDQPWRDDDTSWYTPSLKEIEGSDEPHQSPYHHPQNPPDEVHPKPRLEHMRLSPDMSYLCLIPPPVESPPASSPPEDRQADDATPMHSWSLLQPLTGSCLYHRQGWFTYSYCHNQEIRQFRELPVSHLPAGGYQPEEDPDWESYTLGRAPPTPEPGADLTVAEQNAHAANLELARGAGSRYLVQRWGDGTVCDKTGRKREVEVQFHCSMTMTDTILFVKEAKTCSYVLVVHTPRLCGEPGFKSRLEAREEALVRCREVVRAPPAAQAGLLPDAEADHPVRPAWQKPPPAVPRPSPRAADPQQDAADGGAPAATTEDTLRRALEVLMGDGLLGVENAQVVQIGEHGEVMIEFDVGAPAEGEDGEDAAARSAAALHEALRAAGFDVQGAGDAEGEDNEGELGEASDADEKQQHYDGQHPDYGRDEL